MISTLAKLLNLCTKHQRRQMIYVLMAIIVAALIQTTSVASIIPFLAVVANPDVIHDNPYLGYFYEFLDMRDGNQFLIVLGIAVLIILLVSNLFSALTLWMLLRFSHGFGHALSERLFASYLSQPYSFFIERNTTELSKNVLTETARVTSGVVTPTLQFISRCTSTLFVVGLLLFVSPKLSISLTLLLLGAYLFIFLLFRNRLSTMGRQVTEARRTRFAVTGAVFGAIKYVKLTGIEAPFLERYSRASRLMAACDTANGAIGQLPRFALEVLAFGSIVVVVLYVLRTEGDIRQALPLVGLYAFAAYRLFPELQQVFRTATATRYNKPALDILLQGLTQETADPRQLDGLALPEPPLELTNALELHDVSFTHATTGAPTLVEFSLLIEPGTVVGIAGPTGAGKTTLIDILAGLISPTIGELRVDGTRVSPKNARAWQESLGYVPQNIVLLDDTVKGNIAFGVGEDDVDLDRLEHSARVAQLHDFVSDTLPDGYDTRVGEHGIRLSGGEQQRIGVARALYRDPRVLILDEATSALDGFTERALIDEIVDLSPSVTVIFVTHRLRSLKRCDVVYVLDKGRIVCSGDYEQLCSSSPHFRKMLSESGETEDIDSLGRAGSRN